MTMTLRSTVFEDGGAIPPKYTAEGENASPPLQWSDPPEGTKTLALIVDDPDAPGEQDFTHWVIFNIPRHMRDLPEGVAPRPTLQDDIAQGQNDFGQLGYGGPQPPGDETHKYHFHLYALDSGFDAEPGLSKGDLLERMQGHILAEGQMFGIYRKMPRTIEEEQTKG